MVNFDSYAESDWFNEMKWEKLVIRDRMTGDQLWQYPLKPGEQVTDEQIEQLHENYLADGVVVNIEIVEI
jgi:hypothetical protein